jgi:hypothetical protein
MAFGLNHNMFNQMSANHDGIVTRDELNNFADFRCADLNHDGCIDPYELKQYRDNNRMGLPLCK